MTKEEIGGNIRERRKLLKKTQEDIAEISGVCLRSIINIETGRGNPSIDSIYKVLSILGLSFELKSSIPG